MSASALTPTPPRRFSPALAGVLLVVVGAVAYHNSFSGPFVFDDLPTIPGNPTIRQLWPLGPVLSPPVDLGLPVTGRPVVNLTLALNYAWTGTAVWSYHVVNLLIHTLAAFALFGLVRRTLGGFARFKEDATLTAFAVAVLWIAHPLQTAAVTYTVQRAEALVGLFYLFTLYATARAAAKDSSASTEWQVAAVSACALGMATKEVMVSAPLLALLYDRTFVSGSFAGAWRARRGFYFALAATWLVLGGLMLGSGARGGTAGFGLGIPWWQYAATQCAAILHYLRLVVWPTPLVFDYGGDVLVSGFGAVWPQALVLAALLAGTGWALWRKPWLGFLGVWCWAILAPTSSVVPLADTMFEHRMYLPLAALVVLAVVAGHAVLQRSAVWLALGMSVACVIATVRRNEDYRSELSLWRDTVAKRPQNARAHYTLGAVLAAAGGDEAAIAEYEAALTLKPRSAEAHNNLGNVLTRLGRHAEAAEHYASALQTAPSADTHSNLGNLLLRLGRPAEARAHYEAALALRPDSADAHNNLGNLLAQAGDFPAAASHYEAALRSRPDLADAHANLGNVLAQTGRAAEAVPHYEAALRLRPEFADAHFNLGTALLELRRGGEAIPHYEAVLRLQPDYPEVRSALARAQAMRDVFGK
ncbi:MAG: tetratricopeptide repeat protein [Verrucomicrobia bacterium]|nr:tetratricopeptide repeat protein [Verrucomicrobiota bacterium]